MIIASGKLIKKYATAFLRTLKNEQRDLHIEIITAYENFVSRNKVFQATLELPSFTIEKKHELIELVAKKIQISPELKKLTLLLLKDKRIHLLGGVLKKILQLHKESEQQHHFHVSTSHKISQSEQKIILNFIKKTIDNNITASFDIDVSLLSGIKIRSNTLFWERSIAKKLREIEQKITRREDLW